MFKYYERSEILIIRFCKQNQENIIKNLHNGNFDNFYISTTSLVDDIILSMQEKRYS